MTLPLDVNKNLPKIFSTLPPAASSVSKPSFSGVGLLVFTISTNKTALLYSPDRLLS